MSVHIHRSALVAHPAEHVFDIIEAAEHYPEFLPWCASTQILERTPELVSARLEVDWHGVKFGFVTRNPKRRPGWMAITMEEGPFRHFQGEWKLTPLASWGCRVEFELSYEFNTTLVGKMAGPVFEHAANTMVDAYVRRADEVPHAPPAPG